MVFATESDSIYELSAPFQPSAHTLARRMLFFHFGVGGSDGIGFEI